MLSTALTPALIVVALASAAGLALGMRQVRELDVQQRQQATTRHSVLHLRQELAAADAVRGQDEAAVGAERTAMVAFVPDSGDAAFDARLRTLVRKVYRLRHWIDEHPEENVPDLAFASDGTWLQVAAHLHMFTETELRRASRELRHGAQFNFLFLAVSALHDYEAHSGGWLPHTMPDLAPYFVTPPSDAMLARFEITASGQAKDVAPEQPVFSERMAPEQREFAETTSVDGVPVCLASVPTGDPRQDRDNAAMTAIFRAMETYRRAHHGQHPKDASELRPFIKNPALLEGITLSPDGDGFSKTFEH